MVALTSSIALSRKGNLGSTTAADRTGGPRLRAGPRSGAPSVTETRAANAFLRVPPFPGAKISSLDNSVSAPLPLERARQLLDRVRDLRVGGTYWGARPTLPSEYVLVADASDATSAAQFFSGATVVRWDDGCDSWHMLARASALVAGLSDEATVIAAILDVPIYVSGADGGLQLQAVDPAAALSGALTGSYTNPFTGDPMPAEDAVELCGFWRSMIDSNRDLAGGLGFAFWKQDAVAPLLWGGDKPFEFLSVEASLAPGQPVAVWRSKAPSEAIARLEEAASPLVEVEDGFLRSQGLGADCVPPLSITVDRLGAYFDHAQPSELETLLQNGRFDSETLERAAKLRSVIVDSGIGKYGAGTSEVDRPAGDRRLILVPGQVEDDRSVMTGGGGLSNYDLLKRVRAGAPDACILYKPHPDVLAGHRKGAIPERRCLELADQIVGDASVASLLGMVDEVHVNTSLTGFEALLRGKHVVTHGVPFYAGWGLTRDLGPVPARRNAKRTLDELVAATLLIYPRYLDPVTGLPCPAEIVTDRLCNGAVGSDGWVVKLRRLQGKVVRGLRGVFP